MPRKRTVDASLVDDIAQNLFLALPIFRKRLLHMDVIQRDFDIPLSHVQVLAMLNDNGSTSVSDISRRLGIAKPNVTPLVNRLIERGYVERSRSAEDRRMVRLNILPSGRDRLGEIRARMTDLVGEWAEQMSSADLRTLNQSLRSITQILGATLQAR